MTTPRIKRAGLLLGLGALLAFGPAALLQAQTVEVALGASGETVTLTAAEGGGYTRDGAAFASGSEVTASDGSRYVLTLADGIWSAVRQVVTVPIAGTGLTATVLPEGGYRIGEATLGADGGRVDVTEGGASYHVLATADGELSGVRFDLPIDGRVLRRAAGKDSGVTPALSEDDGKTAADETGTQLKVGGATFSIGELLASGAASASGANIVAGAHRKVAALRDRAVALVALFDGGGLERSTLSTLLGSLWDEADDAIEDVVQPDIALERDINPRRVVDALDQVVEALATEDGFVAAVAGGGDGVLAGANIGAGGARTVFNRNKWEASAVLDTLGGTRFGAMYRREHPDADRGIADVAREAFAWSTLEGLRRLDDIQTAGNGYYEGRTLAVDSGRKFYAGDIELQVRFTRAKVNGLVTDLRNTATGELWSRGLGGPVEAIFLPEADLRRTANWTARSGDARLSYVPTAGGYGDVIESGSRFEGRLLGVGEDAGAEAVGVWSVGSVLAGGFGAVLGGERAEPGEDLIANVTKVGRSQPGTSRNTSFSAAHFDGTNLRFQEVRREGDTGRPRTLTFNVSLARLFGGDNPYEVTTEASNFDTSADSAQQEVLIESHREVALKALTAERDFLRQFAEVFPAGSEEAVAKSEREDALGRAITVIDEELFGTVGADSLVPGRKNSAGSRILAEGEGADSRGSFSGIYPTTASGALADNVIFTRLDAAIEALSSREALGEAFEEGGIFSGNFNGRSEPYLRQVTTDQLFDKSKYRLHLWTERTDYTRMGVWRLQHSQYASQSFDPEAPEWFGTAVEGFAYSPLERTSYTSASEATYPGGASATYEGWATAAQGSSKVNNAIYTGTSEVTVYWDADSVGGDMAVKLIDLTSTDPRYGKLRHGWSDIQDPETGLYTVPRQGVFDVRSLTFQAEITTNSSGQLGFRAKERTSVEVELDTIDGKPTPWIDTRDLASNGDAKYWSGYSPAWTSGRTRSISSLTLDPNANVVVAGVQRDASGLTPLAGLKVLNPSSWRPISAFTGLAGNFVGQNQDGPLAVIGLFQIGSNNTGSGAIANRGGSLLGLGTMSELRTHIRGAFGADIAP